MISSVTSSISQNSESGAGLGGLGTDLFLELLIAQMQNQNPLEPMDGAALMTQTSQLANVEAIQAMSELQAHIVGLSQFGNATTMIGRVVQANDPTFGLIEGVVTGVSTSPTGPVLQIGDRSVSVDDVTSVLSGFSDAVRAVTQPTPETVTAADPSSVDPVSEDPVPEDPISEDPVSDDPVSDDPASQNPVSEDTPG